MIRAEAGAAVADPGLAQLARLVEADVRRGVAMAAGDRSGLVRLVTSVAERLGLVLGMADLLAVSDLVAAGLWGLGPLQPLVRLEKVTDVLVNGPDEVWVDRGSGLSRVSCPLGTEADVRALAVRLAASAGRRLDEASPFVDARLRGGLRFYAALPPVSPAGTVICLRILRRGELDLTAIADGGGMPPDWLPILEALVLRRAAFLVSGGTGAGKTTLLAALLSLVPATERIVLVEDVGELRPQHPHVVRLEARPPNVEGRGTVTLADLVRQALRMRPDRLVVGECRGGEVRDLLTALNTGHAGGCGTVHANSAADVPARLEALGSLADLSPAAVRTQAASALDAVLHLERTPAGRRLVEIASVGRDPDGALRLRTAVRASAGGTSVGTAGPGWPELAERLGLDGNGAGRRAS